MKIIEIKNDERFDKVFPKICSSEVIITLNSGNIISSGPIQAKGDWDNPLSETEKIEKFKCLAAYCKKDKEIENIIEKILTLDKLAKLDNFYKLIS
jgi:2-methylcitrate dehydratase PrpD